MIGINPRLACFNSNQRIEKDLTVTLTDFGFFDKKDEISKFEHSFNKNAESIKSSTGIELDKNEDSFLENINFHRMRANPYSPETNELLGSDLVIVGLNTGEPVISILTKVTLLGNYGTENESTDLTKAGFEKHGVAGPISDEQMMEYSENIKNWLVNGGSPGKEITEEDLYNIAVDGKLDDLSSLSSENLALKSLTDQSTKCYEAMSKMIDEIKENDKKVNCEV